MKKVLLITYYWPPTGGSGVQRWLKFAKYLPDYGWEPIIYTPLNPAAESTDPNLEKDIRPGTKVLKTRILEPYSIYNILTGRKSNAAVGAGVTANAGNGNKESITKRISKWIRGNVFIPDPRCLWIRPSVKFLTEWLKDNPVDAIISTGPPHSMQLIAKQVSRNTGIKWIADFRDPWTGMFYFKHLNLSKKSEARHKKLEQEVINNANGIIVVTESMRRDFSAKTGTPVHVITNGYDPQDFQTPMTKEQEEAKRFFEITHTGLMVENGNPSVLWKLLGQMAKADEDFRNQLRIRLIGNTENSIIQDIQNNGLANNLINLGYIPHSQIPGWQKCASVLILPLRKEPEAAAILTGKVFEYLYSTADSNGNHPVIAGFGPETGDLAYLLKDAGCGAVYDWDNEEEIKKTIAVEYLKFKERLNQGEKNSSADEAYESIEEESRESRSKVEAFSRPALTEKLARLLEDIGKRSKETDAEKQKR